MDNAIGRIQNALRGAQIRPRIFLSLRKLSRMYNGFDLTCKLQHHCKKPPQVRLPYKTHTKRMTVRKGHLHWFILALCLTFKSESPACVNTHQFPDSGERATAAETDEKEGVKSNSSIHVHPPARISISISMSTTTPSTSKSSSALLPPSHFPLRKKSPPSVKNFQKREK